MHRTSGSDSAPRSPVSRANRRTALMDSSSGSRTFSSKGNVASVCLACLSLISRSTSGMVTASSARRSRRMPFTMAFASTTTLVLPASASGTRGAEATGASAFAAASQPDMLSLSGESRARGGHTRRAAESEDASEETTRAAAAAANAKISPVFTCLARTTRKTFCMGNWSEPVVSSR